MSRFLVLASMLFAGFTSFAAEPTAADCLARVQADGCRLNRYDVSDASRSVDKCRQVMSLGAANKAQVFLLKGSSDLVVIRSRGERGVNPPFCPAKRFSVDSSGAKDMIVINHNVFVLSNSGRVFMVQPDGDLLEVLSTENRSYSTVVDIRQGRESVKNVRFIGRSFEKELTPDELNKRIQVQIPKRSNTTRDVLFLD